MAALPLAVGLLIVVLAGCSSDDPVESESTVPTEDTTGQVGRDDDATDASNYEIAYGICSTTPPEQFVLELGAASTDPFDLADAYAEGYTDPFRQAAFEGCLDALTGQPQQWP